MNLETPDKTPQAVDLSTYDGAAKTESQGFQIGMVDIADGRTQDNEGNLIDVPARRRVDPLPSIRIKLPNTYQILNTK